MALPEIMIGAPETVGGAVAAAPVGTALPTDATSELGAEFTVRGLIGEEGFSLASSRDTTDIKVWGGATKRRLTTDYQETITVTFMESADAEVLKAVFGEDNVNESGGKITIAHNVAGPSEKAWTFTMKDGDARRRVVVPKGQLFLNADVVYVHNDAIKYQVEIACLQDEDGNTTYEYIDDVAAGA